MVQAHALLDGAAAQRTPLHGGAAHLTAAHVAAGQEDDLGLDRDTGGGFTRDLRLYAPPVCVTIETRTAASMQTTHSELPGPSTGLGADGVTGVPGVTGELGAWKAVALGSSGGVKGGEDTDADAASPFF